MKISRLFTRQSGNLLRKRGNFIFCQQEKWNSILKTWNLVEKRGIFNKISEISSKTWNFPKKSHWNFLHLTPLLSTFFSKEQGLKCLDPLPRRIYKISSLDQKITKPKKSREIKWILWFRRKLSILKIFRSIFSLNKIHVFLLKILSFFSLSQGKKKYFLKSKHISK